MNCGNKGLSFHLLWQRFSHGTKWITTRVLCVSLISMSMTLPHHPFQHQFTQDVHLCIQIWVFLLSVFLLLSCFLIRRLPVSSQDVNALVFSSAYYSCGLVKPFHSKMLGETNFGTSSISWTRSKWCNSQNISSMQLLLCSTLEYHTLLYQEVVLSLMTFLMKWCSYTSLLTLSPSWSCLECWVCI
jgi:hypothetical protein